MSAEPRPLTDLRERVAEAIEDASDSIYDGARLADAVLAVMRERLLEQITANRQRGFSYLRKEDVLALFEADA